MAQLVMTFDTVEKTLAVTLDGAPVENIIEVYSMRSYDNPKDYSCSVMTGSKDEKNDLKTYTRMVATEQGLVEDKSSVHKAIASYLGKE